MSVFSCTCSVGHSGVCCTTTDPEQGLYTASLHPAGILESACSQRWQSQCKLHVGCFSVRNITYSYQHVLLASLFWQVVYSVDPNYVKPVLVVVACKINGGKDWRHFSGLKLGTLCAAWQIEVLHIVKINSNMGLCRRLATVCPVPY